MIKPKSHTEIAYSGIDCFTDDGTLDIGEINFLLGPAMRDGQIDEDEKRILKNIFSKVQQSEVAPQVWERIQAVRQQHGID